MDRNAQLTELARHVQQVPGHTAKVAFADRGYLDEIATQPERDEGIEQQVIKLQAATNGND